MLTINNTYIHEDGKTIKYDYSYPQYLKKYFTESPFYVSYDVNISDVPLGILNLPLVANLLPISWFVGFDIHVNELDHVFYQQVAVLKKQFAEYHPIIKSEKSNLIVDNLLEPSDPTSSKKAMLFSGGVDAYATLLRHFDEVPDLITIGGVDMALTDEVQWNGLIKFNNDTKAIQQNNKYYIKSSLRTSISFEVNRLVAGHDWYGSVQHGLTITCLTAPLAYLNNYDVVYIASSFDRKAGYEFFLWGSLPEIDHLIKFNQTSIAHDGFELDRQEKINSIVDWSLSNKQNVQLRVCYSNKGEDLNCSRCSKCLMTIFAILNTNQNPNDFGFQVDISVFSKLKHLLKDGFESRVKLFFWKEVYLESKKTAHRFNDQEADWMQAYMEADQMLQKNLSKPIKGKSVIWKLKTDFIRRYPNWYNIYVNARKNLS